MKTNYKALELKLRRIVEKRLEEGWNVTPGTGAWVGDGSCCAIGAAMVPYPSSRFSDSAAKILCVDFDFVNAVSHGFEDVASWFDAHPGYAIGARIRRLYCEFEGAE